MANASEHNDNEAMMKPRGWVNKCSMTFCSKYLRHFLAVSPMRLIMQNMFMRMWGPKAPFDGFWIVLRCFPGSLQMPEECI